MLIATTLKDAAYAAFRTLCAALCQAIYPIISFSYKLFMDLATFRLLGSKAMTEIYGRITMILTIVMVFYITFEFVKYAISPDTMTDKEKGVSKLPQKMIFIIVLIAFIPNIFALLHNIQVTIIKNDIITKIMLGKTYTVSDNSNEYENIGNKFSWGILSMFYDSDSEEKCDGIECQYIVAMNESSMNNYGTVPYMTLGINETKKENTESGTIEVPYIHFEPLWAVLVGGFVAYMLILYCVDLGARSIQLMYLQIISPIAIIGILSPKKENTFQKWGKQLLTTYLDVFIRLILISFILLVSEMLINNTNQFSSASNYIKIALILGMLVFAKKAPKLLEELFPKMGAAGGNFGLKAGDRNLGRVLGAALGLTAGTVAGAASGLAQGARKWKSVDPKDQHARRKQIWAGTTGALGGAVRGGFGGGSRGLWNGGKEDSNKGFGKMLKNSTVGATKQFKSNKIYGNKLENGYTLGEQIRDKVGGAFGASYIEEQEKRKAPKERLAKERQAELDSGKKTGDKAFENATVKGKGYNENQRIKNAVDRYNKVEQRERELQDPNSTLRGEYRAGKVRHDKRNEYETALNSRNSRLASIDTDTYKQSIDENSLGLDKNKFKKQQKEKIYDSQAHEAAKSQYMRDTGIIGADGKPLRSFDEVAWQKDKDKFTKEKTSEVFDQNAYDAAVATEKERKAEEYKQQETNRINQEFENKVRTDGLLYTTESAEDAFAAEKTAIIQEKKKAKDEVQFAYEDWALQDNGSGGHNDDELYRWRREDEERMELYNDSATTENKVDKAGEVAKIMDRMYQQAQDNYARSHGISVTDIPEDIDRDIREGISRAKAEDEWRKQVVSNKKMEAQFVVDEANAAIEEHKRKTSGSTDKK